MKTCENCENYKEKEPEKTCGNCGNHSVAVSQNYKYRCDLNLNVYTPDGQKAGQISNCSWKPKCPTCRGSGMVEEKHCGACKICHYDSKRRSVNSCVHSYCMNIPCPTCQPKEETEPPIVKISPVSEKVYTIKLKEERLMMPVRWEIKNGVHCLVLGRKRIAEIYSDFGGLWRIGSCIGHDEDNFAHKYGELFSAQQAVEKTLGIVKQRLWG